MWCFPGNKSDNCQNIMNFKAIFNYMPGLGDLCNKKATASVFANIARHYSDLVDFVPLTFRLPEE
jgi:hypothetical protein